MLKPAKQNPWRFEKSKRTPDPMADYLQNLIDEHSRSGILIDTNIILLLFVGSFSLKLLSDFKRTQEFTQEDYEILTRFLEPFNKRITTPNIMTEVYNLSNQLPNHLKPAYFANFGNVSRTFEETYTPSSDITRTTQFLSLGLTDAGIYLTAQKGYLVLTEDFHLSQTLAAYGLKVLNFNHLRTYL